MGKLCEGFMFDKNEGKGLFGMGGKLIIQPEYQRNYIYDKDGKDVDRRSKEKNEEDLTIALSPPRFLVGYRAAISFSFKETMLVYFPSAELWSVIFFSRSNFAAFW